MRVSIEKENKAFNGVVNFWSQRYIYVSLGFTEEKEEESIK